MQPAMRKHESFWLDQIDALTEIPSLPTDMSSDDQVPWAGHRHSSHIPDDIRHALRRMSTTQKVTEFTVLFAAFELAINKQFGTNQVVVGIPTSGRDIEGSESVVGHCVNIIPFVLERRKHETSQHCIKDTEERLGATLNRRAYPFAKFICPESDTKINHQRIFNVTFNKDKTVYTSESGPLTLRIQKQALQFCRYDLSFNLSELGGTGIILDVEYRSALFAPETIESLAKTYITYLNSLVSGRLVNS